MSLSHDLDALYSFNLEWLIGLGMVPQKGMVVSSAGGALSPSRLSSELDAADSDGPSSFVINTYAGAPGGIVVRLRYDHGNHEKATYGKHMVPVIKQLAQTSSFKGILS